MKGETQQVRAGAQYLDGPKMVKPSHSLELIEVLPGKT